MTSIQQSVCTAVSRHTKVKRDTVTQAVKDYLEEVGADSPVITIKLDQVDFNLTIGESKNTIRLGEMMFFKYLEKTDLFGDIVNMLGDRVDAVAFSAGEALLVARILPEYKGTGGIFVKRNSDSIVGYAIEPIAHYLADNHPIYREE
jgi:hypothetical protein